MKTPTLPFVSVLMPIRNEGGHIGRSLGAVLGQDYPRDRMEVVVADGMSTDGTRELVRSLSGPTPLVRLIDNPGGIVATGLNAALRVARGEILVRVDGHCEVAADYVRRCVGHLQAGVAEGVGGPIETVGETPVARAVALAMSSRFGVGGSAFRTDRRRTALVDTVAFPAYTRAIVDRAGPFDEELVRNQDDEFNYRIRSLGGRILLASDIQSRYYSRGSLRSLWRQYFQYGYWKVRVLQKHPRQMQPRQFVPPLFVGTLLALAVAAAFSAIGVAGLQLLVATYIAANLGAALVAARRSVRLWPFVSLAFAILHLAYGSGFLVGLVRFMGRWRRLDPVAAAHVAGTPAAIPVTQDPEQTRSPHRE